MTDAACDHLPSYSHSGIWLPSRAVSSQERARGAAGPMGCEVRAGLEDITVPLAMDSIGVMPLLQGHKRPCRLLKTRDVTQALTVAGGARPDIAYFSMSAVGVFRVALTGRIERLGPPEARARVRAIEEPYFEECRQRFFALDQFPENADRFAITYADVYDEVANRAGQRAT